MNNLRKITTIILAAATQIGTSILFTWILVILFKISCSNTLILAVCGIILSALFTNKTLKYAKVDKKIISKVTGILLFLLAFIVILMTMMQENSYRRSGSNGYIQQSLGNARVEIQQFKEVSGSYQGVCMNEKVRGFFSNAVEKYSDPESITNPDCRGLVWKTIFPKSIITDTDDILTCNDNQSGYVVSTKLISPENDQAWWCIDSQGSAKRKSSALGESLSCDEDK